jgi:hypothetical protein
MAIWYQIEEPARRSHACHLQGAEGDGRRLGNTHNSQGWGTEWFSEFARAVTVPISLSVTESLARLVCVF